jgi:hypothetical protein
MLETSEELLCLRKSCKTPSDAIVKLAAARGGDTAEADGKVWAHWLQGVRWGGLTGSFVDATSLPNCCDKSLDTSSCVQIAGYTSYEPMHASFCNNIGIEDNPAFQNSFCRVWTAGEGELSQTDAEALAQQALDASIAD